MPPFLDHLRSRWRRPQTAATFAQQTERDRRDLATARAIGEAALARRAERDRQNARVRARRLLTYDRAAERAARDFAAGETSNPFTIAFADDWMPAGAWEATRAQLDAGRAPAELTRPDGTLVGHVPDEIQTAYQQLGQSFSVTGEHERHEAWMQAGVDAWEREVDEAADRARALATGISAEQLATAEQLAEAIDSELEADEIRQAHEEQRVLEATGYEDPFDRAVRRHEESLLDVADTRADAALGAWDLAAAAHDYDDAFEGGAQNYEQAPNPYDADELRDAWDAGEQHQRALDEWKAATGKSRIHPDAPVAHRPDGSKVGYPPPGVDERVFNDVTTVRALGDDPYGIEL